MTKTYKRNLDGLFPSSALLKQTLGTRNLELKLPIICALSEGKSLTASEIRRSIYDSKGFVYEEEGYAVCPSKVNKALHEFEEFGLVESKKKNDGTVKYIPTQKGSIIFEFLKGTYECVPDPWLISPRQLKEKLLTVNKPLADTVYEAKEEKRVQRETKEGNVMVYKSPGGLALESLVEPLIAQGLIKSQCVLLGKDFLQEVIDKPVLGGTGHLLYAPDDLNTKELMKTKVESQLGITANELGKKITLLGCFVTAADCSLIFPKGVEVKELNRIYVTDGPTFDMLVANKIVEHKMVPVSFDVLLEEVVNSLESKEYISKKIGFLVKDQVRCLLKMHYPDFEWIKSIPCKEFINSYQTVTINRQYAEQNPWLVREIKRGMKRLADKLESRRHKVKLAIEYLSRLPEDFKEYESYFPKIKELRIYVELW
ncbi:MAG: hypothetical protein ACPLY9_01480 [Nitrososphaerales archaeon]